MRRIPEFDALRALAALAVLAFHLNPAGFPPGWTGVDLFFVLSGYLITNIILKYKESKRFLSSFYMRRGLRIWPVYYLVFLALVAANRWLPRPFSLEALPYYLTYTQNLTLYWGKPFPPFNPAFDHTWTLALEEQYYLIWPALVLIAGPRRVVPMALVLMAVAYVARSGFRIYFGIPMVLDAMSERLLVARCDGFALGGMLAALCADAEVDERAARRLRSILWGSLAIGGGYLGVHFVRGGLGSLGVPTPSDPATAILMVNLFYFAIVGLVVRGHGSPWLAPLRFRPLCYLGLISYGIYMYHYVIYWIVDGCRGGHNPFVYEQAWTVRALKVGLTLAVASASWHFFERPILRLKERFRYTKAQRVAVAA